MIEAARKGASLAIRSEHLNYQYATDPVSADVADSLLRDFG
jgi:hypothetical protein